MVIEQIITKANELSLPDFLKWLITSGILVKLGKEQYQKVKEIIRRKHDKGKYAFFPRKEEVYSLKKLAVKSIYTDFKKLLKGHWGMDVVRTALYLSILGHKEDVDLERIKEIKQQVYDNKKLAGIRLLEMVQVGVMRPVLDHIKELKDKYKYSQEDVDRIFEELMESWKKITIFVQNEDAVDDILVKAKEMIDNKEETFFIYAKGNAIKTACCVIVKLQEESYLIEKGYIWFANMDPETKPPSYYCGIHSSAYLL